MNGVEIIYIPLCNLSIDERERCMGITYLQTKKCKYRDTLKNCYTFLRIELKMEIKVRECIYRVECTLNGVYCKGLSVNTYTKYAFYVLFNLGYT